MRSGVVFDRSWLEEVRMAKELTQTQVALAAKTSVSNYCRIEKGLYTPDVKTGLRICNFLGLNPKKFLSEKPIT